RLPRPAPGGVPDLAAVAAALRAREAVAADACRRLRDDAARVAGELAAMARETLGGDLDGDPVACLEEASAAAVAAASRAEGDLDAARRRKATRDALVADAERAAREAETLDLLGRHLRSDRFLDFVLAESMVRVCRAASTRLEGMSDGRYSLVVGTGADAGSLLVVDHQNADERRAVDTLSGGETFQASLALALALAESAGDLGAAARLEAVFVDEGFAALDAESLDLAVDALESVRADDRMVGVITHLPQLADRIPQGLEVVKGPAGSTVRRRAA
ncbi:MAG: SbcC/MukB-like Walker B domain-containing protein, partial [Actinomycetota bacterium]